MNSFKTTQKIFIISDCTLHFYCCMHRIFSNVCCLHGALESVAVLRRLRHCNCNRKNNL